MKSKFKFSPEERNLLRDSLDNFQNDVIKESVNKIVGAGHSRSHINNSWERSSDPVIIGVGG